jgi:hypothetical protein
MRKKTFPIYLLLIVLGVLLLGIYIWLTTKPITPEKRGQSRNYLVKTTHPVIKAVPLTLETVRRI